MEVFVRLFVDGAVIVSVEQFADFRTAEKDMAKRGHMRTCTGRRNKETLFEQKVTFILEGILFCPLCFCCF